MAWWLQALFMRLMSWSDELVVGLWNPGALVG